MIKKLFLAAAIAAVSATAPASNYIPDMQCFPCVAESYIPDMQCFPCVAEAYIPDMQCFPCIA